MKLAENQIDYLDQVFQRMVKVNATPQDVERESRARLFDTAQHLCVIWGVERVTNILEELAGVLRDQSKVLDPMHESFRMLAKVKSDIAQVPVIEEKNDV